MCWIKFVAILFQRESANTFFELIIYVDYS